MYRYLFIFSCASVDDSVSYTPVYLETYTKLIIADSLNEALAKSEWLVPCSHNEPTVLVALELDNTQNSSPRQTIFEFNRYGEYVMDDRCLKNHSREYDPEEFKWE